MDDMGNRENQFVIEINSHMAKAKSAVNAGAPLMADEYSCLICNTYFRNSLRHMTSYLNY